MATALQDGKLKLNCSTKARATETVGQLRLLQPRTRTLDGTLHDLFTPLYPAMPANNVQPAPFAAAARAAPRFLLLSQPMGAERAERLGMINYVVPEDELEAFTVKLAGQILANAPLSISVMKEQLRILAGARPMSPQGFERVQGLRRLVYSSADYQEGIRAFKEKRKPVYNGK